MQAVVKNMSPLLWPLHNTASVRPDTSVVVPLDSLSGLQTPEKETHNILNVILQQITTSFGYLL